MNGVDIKNAPNCNYSELKSLADNSNYLTECLKSIELKENVKIHFRVRRCMSQISLKCFELWQVQLEAGRRRRHSAERRKSPSRTPSRQTAGSGSLQRAAWHQERWPRE